MRNSVTLTIFYFLFSLLSPAQENKSYSILFYNTENLFDWENDPEVNDDEFTPEGERHWTSTRFQHKITNLSKTLLAATAWDEPLVVGLCEVENRKVLEKLIAQTALTTIPFRIIQKNSPDERGIEVAILYNSKFFIADKYEFFPLKNKDGSIQKTREILYVKGRIKGDHDTLHIFINHWPSRYTGLLETQEKRNLAATMLKQKTDSLFIQNSNAKIIILGDFNDEPTDQSMKQYLQALPKPQKPESAKLYNLSYFWKEEGKGSLKYQSQWFVFDQIIVSSALIYQDQMRGILVGGADIVNESFLLTPDERNGGFRLKRTYYGFDYQGGFSDHLPVKLTLEIH